MRCLAVLIVGMSILMMSTGMAAEPPRHACDEEAASPSDQARVMAGVVWEAIDVPRALTACRNAVAAYPGVARFRYQYARTLLKAERYREAVPLLERLASAQYAAAQAALGSMYDLGVGVSQDIAKALAWYHRAAENGDPDAQFTLGSIYYLGERVAQDDVKSFRWYLAAAEQGHVSAQVMVGIAYEDGDGVAQSYEEARRWYHSAAKNGDPEAQYFLGSLYRWGNGTEQDLHKAARWYHEAAQQGDAGAQDALATMYKNGEGLTRDYAQAAHWYRQAAEQGEEQAQYALGNLYYYGQGVARDFSAAAVWYQKSAEQGYRYAQVGLASLYHGGSGVTQNFAVAAQWYRRAAEQGSAVAQKQLGQFYAFGLGLEQDYAEAAKWINRAAEQDDPDALVALADLHLNGLGVAFDFERADRLLRRALSLTPRSDEESKTKVVGILVLLGSVSHQRGRYAEAESFFKKALVLAENSTKGKHSALGAILIGLSKVLEDEGRLAEAKELSRRGLLAIRSNPEATVMDPVLFAQMMDVTSSFTTSALDREAVSDSYQAIVPKLRQANAKSPYFASVLEAYAKAYARLDELDDAAKLYQEALRIRTALHSKNHPYTANTIAKLAGIRIQQGRLQEAQDLFREAKTISDSLGLRQHPLVAIYTAMFAAAYAGQGNYQAALDLNRQATRLYQERIRLSGRQLSRNDLAENESIRNIFTQHIALITRRIEAKAEASNDLIAESFKVGQLARAIDVRQAITQMAARFSAGDDELARFVRERQNAVDQWRRIDALMIQSSSQQSTAQQATSIETLAAKLNSLQDRIRKADEILAVRFPKYRELVNPGPASIAKTAGLLKQDEAMVAYLVGDDQTYVWVVRPGRTDLLWLNLGRSELNKAIIKLRQGLDPQAIRHGQTLPRFDVSLAYDLYDKFFAPLRPALDGVKHIFIVPDAGLESLPFGVLVTKRPEGSENLDDGNSGATAIRDLEERGIKKQVVAGKSTKRRDPDNVIHYRDVPWLIRDFAFSTLPSVGALQALRTTATRTRAGKPFVGFGDPVLNRRNNKGSSVEAAMLFQRGAVADVAQVRQLRPLPETAAELLTIARYLGTDEQSLYLENAATETRLRSMDLSDRRVIAFATHGLIAGELTGVAEPALVLTPPASGSESDDGMLTASEVAQLDLNADLVILSACNTAAPDGTPEAKGLSGLAKAFFYAGSRALLVSHWSVASDAATNLTTGMFKAIDAEARIGWAKALRRSMLALMNDKENTIFAHPLFWAPFVIVGEGNPNAVN